jgi:hypothetical protein
MSDKQEEIDLKIEENQKNIFHKEEECRLSCQAIIACRKLVDHYEFLIENEKDSIDFYKTEIDLKIKEISRHKMRINFLTIMIEHYENLNKDYIKPAK